MYVFFRIPYSTTFAGLPDYLQQRNTADAPFFQDDAACSVNCGEWVDLMNPGCLNEVNRLSVHVKSNGPDPLVGLVYSPTPDCPCQSECVRSTYFLYFLPCPYFLFFSRTYIPQETSLS